MAHDPDTLPACVAELHPQHAKATALLLQALMKIEQAIEHAENRVLRAMLMEAHALVLAIARDPIGVPHEIYHCAKWQKQRRRVRRPGSAVRVGQMIQKVSRYLSPEFFQRHFPT